MSTHMAPFQHCFKRVRMFERQPCLKIRYELLGLYTAAAVRRSSVQSELFRQLVPMQARSQPHLFGGKGFLVGKQRENGNSCLRCVAWRGERYRDADSVYFSRHATQRNATQRAAVMEVSLNTNTNQQT